MLFGGSIGDSSGALGGLDLDCPDSGRRQNLTVRESFRHSGTRSYCETAGNRVHSVVWKVKSGSINCTAGALLRSGKNLTPFKYSIEGN